MTSKTSVQTAMLEGPRQLVFHDEVLDMGALGPHEISAVTDATVVSPGTEVAAFVGLPALRPGPTYPRLVGYCSVATVLAIGRKVARVSPGDRVLTLQPHRSAYRVMETDVLATVPPGVRPEHAASTYLFHLGYNALLKTGFIPGFTVAVIGLGTLGLTTTAVAAVSGAHVFAFSDHDTSRERARQAGAQQVYAKDEFDQALADAEHIGSGAGIDLVITTANSWQDWDLALRLPRKGGTIGVLGFPGRGEGTPVSNPLASEFFYDRQLRIVACGQSPNLDVPPHDLRFTIKRNCEHLLDLIRRDVLNPRLVVTDVRPWHKLADVYGRLASREPGLVTCALTWKEDAA